VNGMRTLTLRFACLFPLLLLGGDSPVEGRRVVLHARIFPRESWAPALPPDRTRLHPMGRPFRITVHHSAFTMKTRYPTWSESCAEIRRIQRYHIEDRKWADIGYHFIIDDNGFIWEGRPLTFQGAHAGDFGLNRGNVGIVVLGDFEKTQPTPAAEESLEWLIRKLCLRYGIVKKNVLGHCNLKATKCPGRRLKPLLARIRSRLPGK